MDYVRFHAQLHPLRLAVTDLASDRDWTYAQFDGFVARVSTLLNERGVREGARVACLAKNCAEIIALHHACARLGAIFVPLNWRLSTAELHQLIEDCEPTVTFGDDMATELAIPAEDIHALEGLSHDAAPMPDGHLNDALPSLMLYTSGTTGRPKGVLLSERNLSETAINFTLLGEVDRDSRFLCESPMFHIIGMVTSIRPAFLNGGSVIVSDRFDPDRTFARLADPEIGISHYFCVPQMAVALRASSAFDPDRLRGLKAIFTGGAPHPEAQIRDWLADGLSIVDGYGMSEAGTVFGMPLDRTMIDAKAGCVGIPTPRVLARIVDEDGKPVPDDEPGELQLKGDNIACGYWRREADFHATLTDDGWFRTGDVLTKDADGFFRVTDRKKDMFISGGENVYPGEVECQLIKFAGMREFAVVGVPDEKWGEVGCLFYVPNGDEISLAEIEAYLADKLAKYKVPKKVVAIDALPRNGVGKVLKHELRKMFGG
ncbi:AMP-binding protein [Kordiimonas marina]|uniref:AMP-binding protein n=1 Tax=Kordiimonas marina TaxID=2872312 RepID=UPI001FF50E23|nr:AMP-binding protein [Kordiimonas marina]MCJ9427794.1 AMP-binding protein [Kordiimonas marina]